MARNTAGRIDAYLRSRSSPLAGLGSVFVQAGRANGVDPLLLVAISGAETSFAKYGPSQRIYNPFGWGPGKQFSSYKEAINVVARGLRSGYLDQGLKTIPKIGAKWAPVGAANDPGGLNSAWTKNVTTFYRALGGKAPSLKTAAAVASGAAATSSVAVSPSAPSVVSPDYAGHALRDLGHMAEGSYDPEASLTDLVDTVASANTASAAMTSLQPGVSGAGSTGATTSAPQVTNGGITYHGQKLTHPTDGLPGYPAVDVFAPAGTPFLAPEDGKVIRLSGRGGTSGNVFGWSVYFKGISGRTYFITHLNKNRARGSVKAGQPLGTVSPWQSGDSHAHVGIKGTRR